MLPVGGGEGLLLVAGGLGQVALASIMLPSGQVCVVGCCCCIGGHCSVASITEPSGQV